MTYSSFILNEIHLPAAVCHFYLYHCHDHIYSMSSSCHHYSYHKLCSPFDTNHVILSISSGYQVPVESNSCFKPIYLPSSLPLFHFQHTFSAPTSHASLPPLCHLHFLQHNPIIATFCPS